jgi:hypothetical protein
LHSLVEIGSEALADALLRHAPEPTPALEALEDLRLALDRAGRNHAPHRAAIMGIPGRSVVLRGTLSQALQGSIRAV